MTRPDAQPTDERLCSIHPDHFAPCSKCAGADCCPDEPDHEPTDSLLPYFGAEDGWDAR